MEPNDRLWIPLNDFENFAKHKLFENYKRDCKNIQDDHKLTALMDGVFKDVCELQKKGLKESIRYIHFFFLGSSIIMDCNEIQVNLFSKESYMDKKEVMAIWNPDFILKYHMESVKSVDKLARQRVRGYSRQQYMHFYLYMDKNFGSMPSIIRKIPNRFPCIRTVVYVASTEFTFYPNIMIAEDLLVTEEIKNCLKLFEPNMHVEEIILFDTRTKTDKRYYVLHIKEYGDMDCVPEDKTIFKIKENEKSKYVIRQDAFECIFRRGIMGVMVSEVEDEGIEKICQKKTKSIL